MRHRFIGGALLAAAAVLAGPPPARAQQLSSGSLPVTDGSGGGFQVARNEAHPVHLPTGQAGDSGFYTGFEYVHLFQTRAIGNQTIAVRGFFDRTGQVTGRPGTIVGGGAEALNPRNFSTETAQPGANIELGYRFNDGTKMFVRYLQVYDAQYSLGAGLLPSGVSTRPDLADTFVSSPVFNFPSFFAGPTRAQSNRNVSFIGDVLPGDDEVITTLGNGKVAGVPDTAVFGIWNAASQMDIKFTQRYQEAQIGGRVPMLESDYSRVYGTAGFQFNWFFERFQWRTVSQPRDGNARPQDVAFYTNTLSQRMYGPFAGCGHEIFLANQFSLSGDLSGALLMDVVKFRAKYRLGDHTVQSKWGREEFRLVPNANAAFNLWWYPVEGVQLRAGYQAMTFYNTKYMLDPVGFDYGNIEPRYRFKAFRIVHGFNVGVGFFF